MSQFALVSLASVLIISLLARFAPLWKSRHRGCDAYYYLLCTEEYRKHRKLPIVLPDYYLLDIREQWYPPGFAVFLSWLPEKWLRKHYWLITPLTDTLIALSLYGVLIGTTQRWDVAVVGTLAYSLAWPVLTDCSNLNSRPLGNLLLVGLMLALAQYFESGSWIWIGVSGVAGYLILVTHKMTSQLLYVMLPGMALVSWDWGPVAILGVALLIAGTVSVRMLQRVFKGQADILKFWDRNWRNLGAHQVLSSPVYGDEAREDLGRVFQPGVRGLWLNIQHLGADPFVLPALMVGVWSVASVGLTRTETTMVWWAVLTYALAALTMLVPQFRFYGEGYKYLRLATFPVGYLAGSGLWKTIAASPLGRDQAGILLFQAASITIALLVAVFVILTRQKANSTLNPSVEGDLGNVLEYLKREDVTVVLTVPTHIMDAVVWHCRKKVVWGTHSAGFENVEPMFPVLRAKLGWFVQKYQVSHLVIQESYAKAEKLGLKEPVFRAGEYSVYRTSATS